MSGLLTLLLIVLIPMGMILLFRWLMFRYTGYDPAQRTETNKLFMPRYKDVGVQPTQTKYDLQPARKSKDMPESAPLHQAMERRAAEAAERLEDSADDSEEPIDLAELLKRDHHKP
jgi:hypothetical protein